jgi:outer membrane protein
MRSPSWKHATTLMSVFGRFLSAAILIAGTAGISSAAGNEASPLIARGDTVRYSLKEAIFTALERNPTVTIQRIRTDISRTFASEQRGVFDPFLSGSASTSTTKGQRFLGTQRTPVDLRTDVKQYGLQLDQTLPLGTSIVANGSLSGQKSNLYTSQASGILGLTVTQPLLQGFGLGTNLATLRKANLDVDISKSELKGVAEEVAAQVENGYWDIYLAAEEEDIQEKSVELAERQLQESLERVSVGVLPELELATVRAELATRREALIDARSGYEQACLHFLFLLNPSDSTGLSLVPLPTERPLIPSDSLDTVESHEVLGMRFRSDLNQARFEFRKGQIDVVQTRNGLLPKLDLFVTLGRTTYATVMNKSFPEIDSPFRSQNIGVNLSFPLTERQTIAQYTRAKRSREQLELSVKNLERMAKYDIRSAYIEVLRTRQQINATRVSRELQERKLEAEQEKFRVGKSTNYLVLQVQRDFTASQRDEARSMVSYLEALVNLYLMEGTLLDRRGINTEPNR